MFTSGLHTSSIRQLKVRSSASDPSPEGASQIRKANLNLQQQIQLPVSDRWWSRAFNDERSKRVMEKASSKSFYVTLYVLLAIGMLSDGVIHFRDVNQVTSTAVGLMALLWFGFWIYFNQREI